MTKLLFVLGLLSVVGPLGSGAAFAQGPVQAAGSQTPAEAQEAQGLAPVAPNAGVAPVPTPANLPPPSPGYYSPTPAERPPEVEAKQEPGPGRTLGFGYKIGNGVGFVGADIVINPVEHLSIDLQANYASVGTSRGTATGFALVPGLQGHLWAGQRSSPYLGAALIYLKMGVDGDSVSLTGMAFNVGWEWKWNSGLGIIVGGGVGHIMNVSATNGVEYNGKTTMFNLEAGIRYMFL
jgi:hypothetical protein